MKLRRWANHRLHNLARYSVELINRTKISATSSVVHDATLIKCLFSNLINIVLCFCSSPSYNLTYAIIQLDDYFDWYLRLLESSPEISSRLSSSINVKNCIGYCCCIQRSKKMFSYLSFSKSLLGEQRPTNRLLHRFGWRWSRTRLSSEDSITGWMSCAMEHSLVSEYPNGLQCDQLVDTIL